MLHESRISSLNVDPLLRIQSPYYIIIFHTLTISDPRTPPQIESCRLNLTPFPLHKPSDFRRSILHAFTHHPERTGPWAKTRVKPGNRIPWSRHQRRMMIWQSTTGVYKRICKIKSHTSQKRYFPHYRGTQSCRRRHMSSGPRGGCRVVGVGKRSPHGFRCRNSSILWLAA